MGTTSMTHQRPNGQWFSDARFGMFIHWGLYSCPGGVWQGRKLKHPQAEWLQALAQISRAEYRRLAESFNPAAFDADAWVSEARLAGMRYLVITAKHHDGFALWPSRASAFNVMDATPFKRDILGELAAACRRQGLRLGFYYSHWLDWDGTGGDIYDGPNENPILNMGNAEYVHPTEEQFERYWQGKCLPQVRELIERYDPCLFWFDSWGGLPAHYITERRQEEIISLIRTHSDRCLINSRIQMNAPSPGVDFVSMGDNQFPDQGVEKPWETSGTLNRTWGYHQLDFAWKSTDELLKNLIGNAANGGNYQLNVGPRGEGTFQPAAVMRLRELGAWLQANGEAIYGAERSPLGKPAWGRVTARALPDGRRRLYLHLWNVTPGTALRLDGVPTPIAATVLETGQPVRFAADADGVCLQLPEELRGLQLPVIALDAATINEPS